MAPSASFWDSSSQQASPGGSTSRTKAPCAPYGCAEILAWLEAHPEADNPLLKAYVERQRAAGNRLGVGPG